MIAKIEEPLQEVAIISDVQGNLPALKAVLEEVGLRSGVPAICLGNYVGCCPWPDPALELLRGSGVTLLRSKLDGLVAAGGKMDAITSFRPYDREVISWAVAHIEEALRHFMGKLPLVARFRLGLFECVACHGEVNEDSPLFGEDCRLAAELHALSQFGPELQKLSDDSLFPTLSEHFSAQVYCIGLAQEAFFRRWADKWFISVGALGLPRRDGQAPYLHLTTHQGELKAEFKKVPYDMAAVIEAIRNAGLPLRLADE